MSDFEVLIYPATILPHPNADRLELCQIGGYVSLVGKDTFKDGDLVAFIPPASIVPDSIMKEIGLWDYERNCGKLDGAQKNRVKERRFRQVFSEGLIYPAPEGCEEGDDVAEQLGITKYEPPIPAQMRGKVGNAVGKTINFDIDNIKKWPNVLQEGEDVVITEKIHGTLLQIGVYRRGTEDETEIVTSKGRAKSGIALNDSEENDGNLYVQFFRQYKDQLYKAMDIWFDAYPEDKGQHGDSFYILGEIYGEGVQNLTYGTEKSEMKIFDIYVGEPGTGRYLDWAYLDLTCRDTEFNSVPLLYWGDYSREKLDELTNGQTTLMEDGHIREGVVVKPAVERRAEREKGVSNFQGRVIFKSVSEQYLLKSSGEEIG